LISVHDELEMYQGISHLWIT